MDAEETKVDVAQGGVGGSDLLKRPSKTRSHPAAIPLTLTTGTLEVLKVPTWLAALKMTFG